MVRCIVVLSSIRPVWLYKHVALFATTIKDLDRGLMVPRWRVPQSDLFALDFLRRAQ